MKTLIRSLAVAVAVGLAGVAVTARAQQQDYSKVEIKVTKVSGNVYMPLTEPPNSLSVPVDAPTSTVPPN